MSTLGGERGNNWISEVAALGMEGVSSLTGVEHVSRDRHKPCPACGAETCSASDKRGPVRTKDGEKWTCMACNKFGGPLDLVMFRLFGEVLERGDSRWKELRQRCTDEGWISGKRSEGTPAPPPRREPKRVVRLPDGPPPLREVLAVWNDLCVPVVDDPEVVSWLAAKGISAEPAAQLDLVRALPRQCRWAKPWMKRGGRAWQHLQQEYRVVVPMHNERGEIVSLHARALHPKSSAEKATSPTGFNIGGLVLADSWGQEMLAGAVDVVRASRANREFPGGRRRCGVFIVEGVPDFLAAATLWKSPAPAILGVISGGWSAAIAERIPDDAIVAVATHPDETGDAYADQIGKSLEKRCRLLRCLPNEVTV